ncbi:CoA ester lyase [Piscinibacter sp. XHJ-5]|uniref:HpcH/HpaI aldolase/citrate lyase family protein n=1 Tax=Piscinibacter sp. XHJ-5 TaxID=3037797 RepID=UPI0024533D56|nr:CoA ester lyase [Piscinibacter sp. XHJ-5]
MRSKLFVPASRPELFAKALTGEAEALSFDLEDSVADANKVVARQALHALLLSDAARDSGKVLIVRANATGSPHFGHDVEAVVQPGLALLNVPKVERPGDVLAAAEAVERAERANGFRAGVDAPVGLLLTIETPKALRDAVQLAAAHPRVAGLQLGLSDLFEPLSIARHEPLAVAQAMFALRIAAGAAGVFAYDGAFADIFDAEGYRAEAMLARRHGFLGKSCIHPSQVALANDVFCPDSAEIANAFKVVAAARDAAAHGRGAFMVDGKMIDRPLLASAERIVALARRLKLSLH